MKSTMKFATILAFVTLIASPIAGARDLEKWEWYVQIIVSAEAEGLRDQGNVLGQLNDANLYADRYDLRELEAFSQPYLSIVFYHPEWALAVVDYTSDYHPSTRNKSDKWFFEIRSDNAWRDLTLNWEGQSVDMDRMVLVDLQTGEEVPAMAGDATQDYAFNMNGYTVRAFQWVLLSKKEQHSGKKSRSNTRGRELRVASGYAISDWPPLGWPHSEAVPAGERLPPDPFPD